ncbi:thioredoxin domain-containing protein [Filobacillus milosensis]|uniref:Thioredoxin domain-containing protein n=1 Tax=Filobacillus milosensis TaxID=94137 RepID=A0A4Y8IV96_9BACI|nr:thioredoxin domain-containing protein [Filobacillus milosensis]TFB25003.1 thioredoxin domain-containing protein [Filobacillus milosensis]
MNRLQYEKSPYLLQHKNNPVDWYPWGDEAFEKAKKENKPVFLSIGYSTCHWCHVFERESFEDEQVAELLNKHFVSIKVDREERPDIDAIYMKVCQRMTGHGGWPLSIFMTPEQIPFYAGIYFPKESKYGLPGFKDVIRHLSDTYHNDPGQIEEVTASVQKSLNQVIFKKGKERTSKEVTHQAFHELGKTFDTIYGGFEGAPKFPQPHNLMFLMRYYHQTGKTLAKQMVEKTLNAMAKGGLYDHIGFGFTRYSTDEEWLVPHFEKMLYDQALLLIAYTEAFQLTGNESYKSISEQIIEFVSKEMTSTEGAFYSAIDADSEGKEGMYYIWGRREIYEFLGEELADLYTETYNITTEGNFHGKNIPNLIKTDMGQVAKDYNLSQEHLNEKLEQARQKLLAKREERVYPHLDDKTLTSWNAMMIAALAKAGQVFRNEDYINMAEKAIQFVEEKLILDGRVMARYREGDVKFKGYLDDYAYLIWAYLELYDTTFEIKYLKQAKKLADDLIHLFWDQEHGGFYFSGSDSEQLIANEKDVHDGATPSGNSVATVVLSRLASLTGESKYADCVEDQYRVFYPALSRIPQGSTFFLNSLMMTEFPSKEVVAISPTNDETYKQLMEFKANQFLPQITWHVTQSNENIADLAYFIEGYRSMDDQTTIYVCENFACQKPTIDVSEAIRHLKT